MSSSHTAPDAALVQLGASYNGQALVRQAGYTNGIARGDGTALTRLLPSAHYLDLLEQLSAEVNTARQDKANAAAESQHATSDEATALRKLKVWGRKVVRRANRARLLGKSIPDALTVVSSGNGKNAILGHANEMLGLFRGHLADMTAAGGNAQALLDEGVALYDEVKSADTVQQLKRLSELPDSVKAFFAKKGELYRTLKVINEAGHELHSDDLALAAKYNLKLLRTHHAAATTPPPGSGTPPAGSGNQ